MFKNIAQGEGDLTQRIRIRNQDEVGELGRWFNVFIERVQSIVVDMNQSSLSLKSASENLSGNAQLIANNSENMSQKTDAVMTHTNESSENLGTISAGAEEMSSMMMVVAAAVEELSASISQVSHNCEKETEMTGKASIAAVETVGQHPKCTTRQQFKVYHF